MSLKIIDVWKAVVDVILMNELMPFSKAKYIGATASSVVPLSFHRKCVHVNRFPHLLGDPQELTCCHGGRRRRSECDDGKAWAVVNSDSWCNARGITPFIV